MEVTGSGVEEEDIPIPLNISYGAGQHGHPHMIHHHHQQQQQQQQHSHNHIISSSVIGGPQVPSNGASSVVVVDDLEHHHLKKIIKYKECLKNHAAGMGGNATDGCGEFMPGGEEGSLEALICSACNCHRNFHRKEVEGELNNNNNNSSCETCFHTVNPRIGVGGRKLFMGHPQSIGYHHGGALISARAVAPHQMIMPYSVTASLPSESDDQDDNNGNGNGNGGMTRQLGKKRFRTKFTQEQKEKMLNFAEKVGWKIQKQEEGVVQQFCQEVGVKRRVLKVWMHNNKHNLSKKNTEANPDQNQLQD